MKGPPTLRFHVEIGRFVSYEHFRFIDITQTFNNLAQGVVVYYREGGLGNPASNLVLTHGLINNAF